MSNLPAITRHGPADAPLTAQEERAEQLNAACDAVAPDYPQVEVEAEWSVNRWGQLHACLIVNLDGTHSIDELVLFLLAAKRRALS